ncbi:MAG: PAS domain S-box protein [Acidobacteria bacterium]|nr:PAS domain S-box protein [Acidobacteriota bacterium]
MEPGSPVHPSFWWQAPLRAKGLLLLVVPIATLFAALYFVYRAEQELRATDDVLARAYEVRLELADLRGALVDAQTDVAAYVADSDPRFRDLYEAARRRTAEVQSRLSAAISGDPGSREAIEDILRDTAAIIVRLDGIRDSRRPDGLAAARAARAELYARLNALGETEERRFSQVRARRDRARNGLFRTLLVCATAGPMIAVLVLLLLIGKMVGRLRLVEENAHRLAHGLPLRPMHGGTDEIATLGQELENAARLLGDRERELRESESRYRELFDRAPVPYQETDAGGTIRRVNQAAGVLLRAEPDGIIGRPAWDFVAPGDRQAHREATLRRIADGAETAPFECEYQLDDGTHLTVEIRESLIHNQHGEVTGTVRSVLDITERNLAAMAARKVEQYAMELRIRNEQLARALEAARGATLAKSRFLAAVSHELRTPLNGIIGFSELLHDEKLGPIQETQRDVLDDILTSARHLLRLIGDILDISKVEAGRMEFHPDRHCVGDLVAEVRDVLRPLAEKKTLQFSVDVPAGLEVVLDGARFKQVIYNYISNAIKFTPAGGAIAVRVLPAGADRFRLEVEDTGTGIDEADYKRLFQEFSQLSGGTAGEPGTGLGLALTRHLVEAQGGSVGVRRAPRRGSIFFAELPLGTTAQPRMP